MARIVDVDNMAVVIEETLKEFGDLVYNATEKGLDAAQNVLIRNLEARSPEGPSKKFRKGWKSKGKKYKTRRYVGNTKTVPARGGEEVPLSNILEYSQKSPHRGLIKAIYYDSIEQMEAAIVAEIKKEVR